MEERCGKLKRQGIYWNIIGSSVYAITSMFLGAIVSRRLGTALGGIFFFAFSTFGQQMFIVSYFGMRPIQSTDTARQHTFADYKNARLLTSFVAILVGVLYTFISPMNDIKRATIIAMVVYRVIDGVADCYESEFHRQGRLDMTGRSMCFRTVLSISAFILCLYLTDELILSCVVSVMAQALGLFAFDIYPSWKMEGIDFAKRPRDVWNILREGSWLFLSAFLDLYIFAAAKYAVNDYMDASASAYFTAIFIPTSVINLMANFIIRPVLTTMSEYKDKGQRRQMASLVLRIACLIVVLTIMADICAYLLGIPVLSLLMGDDGLGTYRQALLIVVTGGGVYAVLNLLYYVLVIFGKQRYIFCTYSVGCVVAYFVSGYLVKAIGIDGAAISYLALMILITVAFAVFTILSFIEKRDYDRS